MIKLTTAQRLEAMLKTEILLRTLHATDQTMTYIKYARLVGVVHPGEKWHIAHRKLVSDLLYATAAVAKQAGERLDFDRIVSAATGKPGVGVSKPASITVQHNTKAETARRAAATP